MILRLQPSNNPRRALPKAKPRYSLQKRQKRSMINLLKNLHRQPFKTIQKRQKSSKKRFPKHKSPFNLYNRAKRLKINLYQQIIQSQLFKMNQQRYKLINQLLSIIKCKIQRMHYHHWNNFNYYSQNIFRIVLFKLSLKYKKNSLKKVQRCP